MSAHDNASAASSYFSRLSPWTRSPTVRPSKGKDGEPEPLFQQHSGVDHVVDQIHRSSLRKYPRDCPPLRPMWFHAVDSPKRRPNPAGPRAKDEKALAPPKKYAPFSVRDSKAVEAAYRKLAEERDDIANDDDTRPPTHEVRSRSETNPNLSLKDDGKVRVPVNEDYLFDVDVERRELGPAYWLGPVYEVRRGTWFYQDGGVQKPCEENLAEQLEDGYLKVHAWRLPVAKTLQNARSSSQPRPRPTSWASGLLPRDSTKPSLSTPITPRGSNSDLRKQAVEHAQVPDDVGVSGSRDNEPLQNTYRLFGSHMNSVVTYQDATTAWLISDDFLSRMNYTMYERFAGGGHYGGMKLTRGYTDPAKKAEIKDGKIVSLPDVADGDSLDVNGPRPSGHQSPSEIHRQTLERQMSSLLEDLSGEDREKQAEEVRKRDEREMEEDYREQADERQDREIEHLILVTHGIGQRLGLRIDSVNFVHDVNTFRKTIKAVYSDSPDLKALNAELDKAGTVNSRIQVLPICWRHLLDFPKRSFKHNRKEHDLADADFDDLNYPNLDDITVEGVPAVRNLITDLALDILLYQSPAYKDHISRIVLQECNRIYHLFVERNANFKGKISLVGHSLGSAIMFDLLCEQKRRRSHSVKNAGRTSGNQGFDFDVEDFYALGSPIGLFQMLMGRTIAAREPDSRSRAFSTSMDDPMLDSASLMGKRASRQSADDNMPMDEIPVSSPKCGQVFNIFHPTDPISYRIEPLISSSMSSLKPQPLPYTKRGIFNASMGQGLSGIGARVSQSVSSMWTNVASNLLTRGFGYPGNEAAQSAKSGGPLTLSSDMGAKASNIPHAPLPDSRTEIDKLNHETNGLTLDEGHPRAPTLIDAELETLYSGFQKRRNSGESDASSRDFGIGPEWLGAEDRAKRLRQEEKKVRRLNSNGRVDYAIQEGVFDINLIAAIASHLSYWSDEDVSHFMVSQLLSRGRIAKPATMASNDVQSAV